MTSTGKTRHLGRREFLSLSAAALSAAASGEGSHRERLSLDMYKPNSYVHLIGMDGFSKELLTNHFSLYEGYVSNTNKALGILSTRSQDSVKADV